MTAERQFSEEQRRRHAERERRAEAIEALEDPVVEIEKLVQGGDGFGRVDGIPVFVSRTAPGDRVKVRVVQRRRDYVRAEVVELLVAGPDRRQPPCPVFDRCGGCDLQHLEDDAQVRLKVEAATEALRRLGRLELDRDPEVLTGDAWAYRQRAQWHLERDEPELEEGGGGAGTRVRAGYLQRGSHELVATAVCPILVPELERSLAELPAQLASVPKLPRRIDALALGGKRRFAPAPDPLPKGPLFTKVGSHRFELDPRVFFQSHRGLLEPLMERVVGDDRGGGVVWDLYAGVGLFSIPLAERYRRVEAVESDRIAARYLRKNAKRNRCEQLNVHNVSVEHFVKEQLAREGGGDVERVVVDPPRSGLPLDVLRALKRLGAPRITYVSCQPATLARDVRFLAASYRVERLTYVDLFPQTAHLEAVAQLALREEAAAPSAEGPSE